MATYNGEKYIRRQLDSIIKQLRDDDEVIIVDDFSTDNTINIIEEIKDKRIKVYKNQCNVGFLATFERSIKIATGDVIFLSDQDDIWMDNKLERVLEMFKTSNADIVFHDAVIIDENYEILYRSFSELRKISKSAIKNFIFNSYTGCCMAFKADVRKIILPIPAAAVYHDRWIGIIGDLFNKKIEFIHDKLIYYVRHGNNVSPTSKRALAVILVDRVKLFKAITGRYLQLLRTGAR
jgi:glycosyltransferase involved in cell wall biosynthesis